MADFHGVEFTMLQVLDMPVPHPTPFSGASVSFYVVQKGSVFPINLNTESITTVEDLIYSINMCTSVFAPGVISLNMSGGGGMITVTNLLTDFSIGVFNEAARCVCCVDPGIPLEMSLDALLSTSPPPLDAPPSYFFVPTALHVCSVWAELFRKREAGSYERFEEVWLPSGFYKNLGEVAEAMTAATCMKGERNGCVFKFEVSPKRQVLRIMAHHKQPNGSWLKLYMNDGSKAVGLNQSGSMPLGNRKFLDFEFTPNTVIM